MLDVAEEAPLRMIWVSRTAVSMGRPEPLGDDGGNLVLREIARPLAGTFDQGPQLVVREVAQRGVDLGEAGPGRQQDRQDLAGELLPFGLGQSQDLPGERPDSNGVHRAPFLLGGHPSMAPTDRTDARGLALSCAEGFTDRDNLKSASVG